MLYSYSRHSLLQLFGLCLGIEGGSEGAWNIVGSHFSADKTLRDKVNCILLMAEFQPPSHLRHLRVIYHQPQSMTVCWLPSNCADWSVVLLELENAEKDWGHFSTFTSSPHEGKSTNRPRAFFLVFLFAKFLVGFVGMPGACNYWSPYTMSDPSSHPVILLHQVELQFLRHFDHVKPSSAPTLLLSPDFTRGHNVVSRIPARLV